VVARLERPAHRAGGGVQGVQLAVERGDVDRAVAPERRRGDDVAERPGAPALPAGGGRARRPAGRASPSRSCRRRRTRAWSRPRCPRRAPTRERPCARGSGRRHRRCCRRRRRRPATARRCPPTSAPAGRPAPAATAARSRAPGAARRAGRRAHVAQQLVAGAERHVAVGRHGRRASTIPPVSRRQRGVPFSRTATNVWSAEPT